MSSFETIIKPNSNWLRIEWREIWQYRDLLFLIVRRDFVSRFKQTILGPVWFIFQPLAMTAVFTIIFSRVASIPTDDLPPTLFYFCGLLGWNYFSQTFSGVSNTFVHNIHLLGKVYFPRLIIPLAAVFSNLIVFGMQLLCFIVIFVYFKVFTPASDSFALSRYIILLPFVLLQVVLLALGVGLWMASLTAKYRDLIHAQQFLTQLWLYATPVIYPVSKIPEQYQWIMAVNPMTSIVESFRLILLGKGTLTPAIFFTSFSITLLLLVSGILIFNKVQRNFVDTV